MNADRPIALTLQNSASMFSAWPDVTAASGHGTINADLPHKTNIFRGRRAENT